MTSKTVLSNVFDDRTVRTNFGTITEKIRPLLYKIEDSLERVSIVNSTQEWSIGTSVIVQNGFIIGSGKPSGDYRVLYV